MNTKRGQIQLVLLAREALRSEVRVVCFAAKLGRRPARSVQSSPPPDYHSDRPSLYPITDTGVIIVIPCKSHNITPLLQHRWRRFRRAITHTRKYYYSTRTSGSNRNTIRPECNNTVHNALIIICVYVCYFTRYIDAVVNLAVIYVPRRGVECKRIFFLSFFNVFIYCYYVRMYYKRRRTYI